MQVKITDTIEEISREIGVSYNLKPFPKVLGEDGYLIFSDKKDASSRGKYGHIMAARIAVLIPYLAGLYKHHQNSFADEFKDKVNEVIDGEMVKKLQIVALMYPAGRWHAPNLDPLTAEETNFSEQSSKECSKFLQQIGVSADEVESLSKILTEIDSNESLTKLSVNAAILKDAINLVDDEELNQATSPFCQHVGGN